MITIDKQLARLVTLHFELFNSVINPRDMKIVQYILASCEDDHYITKSQSELLIRIIRAWQGQLVDIETELNAIIATNRWSRSFRSIEQARTLVLSPDNTCIIIKFNASVQLAKDIKSLFLTCGSGVVKIGTAPMYSIALTESNIVKLVDGLVPLNFDIDPTIMDYYTTITSWSEDSIKEKFQIGTITNKHFRKCITDDLGIATSIDQNIISDRSMRYQYFTPKSNDTQLTTVIANRDQAKIWINCQTHSLTAVIRSLVELRRLPVLVVFDSNNQKGSHATLTELSVALKDNDIESHVGIYFRMPSDPQGIQCLNIPR